VEEIKKLTREITREKIIIAILEVARKEKKQQFTVFEIEEIIINIKLN